MSTSLFNDGADLGLTEYLVRAQRCKTTVAPDIEGTLAGLTSGSDWAAGFLHGIALGAELRISLYRGECGILAR